MANKLKKNIVSRGFGAPSPREGRDGDLAVRFVKGQGLFLFYKWANKWYSNRLSLYKNKTNELKDPVRIPIKTPSKVGELGLKGNKAYLLRNHSTTGKNQVFTVDKDGLADVKEVKIPRTETTDMSDTEAKAPDWILENTGHTQIQLHNPAPTAGSTYDLFISFSRLHPETFNLARWITGYDTSAGSFIWSYRSSGTTSTTRGYVPDTPSNSTYQMMTLSNVGNLYTKGQLTIGNIPADSAGNNYLVEVDGIVSKRTPAEVLSDIGASDISFDGSTSNGVLTYKDADEMSVESNLTFSGTVLNTTYLEVGHNLGTAGSSAFIKQIIGYADSAITPAALDFYKARGNEGSPATVAANDFLGTQRYFGYDGDSYELSSAIRGDVDGSVSNGNVPGMLNFLTAPSGTLQSRMVIDSGGSVGIGTWSTTSKPHNTLSVDGTIGLEERASADTDAATYGQLWVKSTDPNELMFTDGDGKDIAISNQVRYVSHNYSNRMSSVNSWYAGYFLNMGTSISASDWTNFHSYLSSIMVATTPCQVKQITISCSASSTEPYEIEIWDVTIPADGASAPSTAAKIGDTIQVNSGSDMTVNRLYNVVHPCNHDLAAGHSMHIATRYTDGSGTKNFYYWLTAEIVETS